MSFISLLAQASSSFSSYPDSSFTTTTTTSPEASAGALTLLFGTFLIPLIIAVIVTVIVLIAEWKIYKKAGKPGWAVIVPIYNIYILQEIVGRPAWWTALYFLPIANMVVAIINAIDLAKSFGKDTGYAILLILLPFVGYPMLGFGSAEYTGPSASGGDLFGSTPANSGQPSGFAAQPTAADQALGGPVTQPTQPVQTVDGMGQNSQTPPPPSNPPVV